MAKVGIFQDGRSSHPSQASSHCAVYHGSVPCGPQERNGNLVNRSPELSWRDIQHIIVRTARPDPVGISGGDWSKNKAGLRMNDYVGFGLMDARGMVDAAINWTTVPPKVNCTIPRLGVNSRIPSRETLEETIDLSNWKDFCRDKINYLEHVEVSVNLNYSRRGDLLIKLISPQQTVSNLTHYRLADSEYGETDLNWVLMSLHHWGENATGVWKLRLHNSQLDRNNTGILFNWTLILHGTTLNPLDDNSHVNTTATPPPIKKPTNRTTTPQSKGYPSIGIVSLTEAFSLKTTQHTRQISTKQDGELAAAARIRAATGVGLGGGIGAIVIGTGVGVKVGVDAGVAVGVAVAVGIGVGVGVVLAAGIGVGVGVGLGVTAIGVLVVVAVIVCKKKESRKRSGELHPLEEKRKEKENTLKELTVPADV